MDEHQTEMNSWLLIFIYSLVINWTKLRQSERLPRH